MRTRYGAETFAALELTLADPLPADDTVAPPDGGSLIPLSASVTDWLTIGGDFRAAFFLTAPRGAAEGRPEPRIGTTFFVMQADLYTSARLGSRTTLVLDIGVNSGFEAWALLNPWPELEDAEIMLKVGRFMPALGLRMANHSLYTRQSVGLGSGQQDTGLELTVDTRHAAVSLAMMNGTLGTPFDGVAEARGFDKALLARASVRLRTGPLSLELGGAAAFNSNTTRANPLFGLSAEQGAGGVNELRGGAFLVAGLGRFALLGDFLIVQDTFRNQTVQERRGYAGYAELSMHVLQGLDALVGFERLDPDLEASADHRHRMSAAVELFPWRFVELRVMARYEYGPGLDTNAVIDLITLLHVYL